MVWAPLRGTALALVWRALSGPLAAPAADFFSLGFDFAFMYFPKKRDHGRHKDLSLGQIEIKKKLLSLYLSKRI
jgi:hypothetical protein